MWLRFFTSEHREGACYINSFEVHGLVDVGSSRLAPSVLRAVAGGLRDPVERARVAEALAAPHRIDGAGRGQRVVAPAALCPKTEIMANN